MKRRLAMLALLPLVALSLSGCNAPKTCGWTCPAPYAVVHGG